MLWICTACTNSPCSLMILSLQWLGHCRNQSWPSRWRSICYTVFKENHEMLLFFFFVVFG